MRGNDFRFHRLRHTLSLLGLLLVSWSVGCGEESPPAQESEPPPRIALDVEKPGASDSGPHYTIRGTVTAGSEVKASAAEGAITASAETIGTVEGGTLERFQVYVEDVAWEYGRYPIEITATRSGLEPQTETVIAKNLGTQDLRILAPHDGATIRGALVIVSVAGEWHSRIKVNGQHAHTVGETNGGQFKRYETEVRLDQGSNRLRVRSTNEQYHPRDKAITVVRKPKRKERASQPPCDPNYAGACIPLYPPDVDCSTTPAEDFRSIGNDPHDLDDEDSDAIACES